MITAAAVVTSVTRVVVLAARAGGVVRKRRGGGGAIAAAEICAKVRRRRLRRRPVDSAISPENDGPVEVGESARQRSKSVKVTVGLLIQMLLRLFSEVFVQEAQVPAKPVNKKEK